MSLHIPKLEFASYWTLLKGLCDSSRGVIFATPAGEALWVSHEMAEDTAHDLVSKVIESGSEGLARGKILAARRENKEVVSAGVRGDNDLPICIIIALGGDEAEGETAGPSLADAVSILRKFLSREIALAKDLDTVSAELGDRYEELNLLYSTEEDLQYFDEPTAAITHLIEKTNLHLNVDAVILKQPDKSIAVSHIEEDSDLSAARANEISDQITRRVMETGMGLSVNDLKDTDGGELFRKLNLKCLAIPLFDSRGVVEGALIALNSPTVRSFSNSDRNLLEVMAKRVRLIQESARDTLTGLLARHAFEQRLKSAQVMSRTTQFTCALLYINIDRLHVINDICGPLAGDAVIRDVATVLQEMLGGENIASRIGGDEFGVLINNCTVKDAMAFGEAICKSIAALTFEWDDVVYELSVSTGIGMITPATENIDAVVSAAEIACTEAKAAGGGRVRVLREHDTVLVMRQNQMKWIGRVQSALRESRFELYAQVIQPLNADEKKIHHEILIRLKGEDGQLVMPDEFLPSAERYNLMPAIDRWVMDHTFERLAGHWEQLDDDLRAAELKNCSWAINLSGQSMCDARLMHFIVERIEHYKLPSEMLCFEVTESAAVRNIADARRLIAALKARGCKFSLDDFGTGVSSFAYLKNLPIDYLKIDGSFVRPILEDATSDAVVSAIQQIAAAMGLATIAEFVESEEIAARLREIGVNYGQGYAFSRPLPLSQVLFHRNSTVVPEVS